MPGERPADAAAARHEAVIEHALFDAAQDARERRAALGRTTIRRDRAIYALSGLATCAHCGGRMTVQPNRNRPRLFCNNRRQGGGCTSKSAPLAIHEAQIGDHLVAFVIPADYRARLAEGQGQTAASADDTAARRKALESRLVRIKEMYGWGDLDRAAYLAERERLQREIAALAAQEDAAGDDLAALAELIGNTEQMWAEATPDQRNRMARLLFEEIAIDENRVMALKPRPELAGFFSLDSQRRGLSSYACTGGSDGDRPRGIESARATRFRPLRSFPADQSTPHRLVATTARQAIPEDAYATILARAPQESLRAIARDYATSAETIRQVLVQQGCGPLLQDGARVKQFFEVNPESWTGREP